MNSATPFFARCRRIAALVGIGAAVILHGEALAQNIDCSTCVPTAACPCVGGAIPFGCTIPGGIGCVDPGGCTGAPGTCLFVPGAPLGDAAGSPQAEEAGRRLQCAVRYALANGVPTVYVCGQYSILNADEFGTDVAAFEKVAAGNVLNVIGRSTLTGDSLIRVSPDAAPKFRFFFVENGGTLTLTNLTLQDGRADTGTNRSGGAVFVESTSSGTGAPSRFEATNCAFNNNFANADGGAIRFEDGNRSSATSNPPVEANAFFRLTRCTFTGNQALQRGGGVASSDIAVVLGCTFTTNRAGATLPPANGLGGGFWAEPRQSGGGNASAPVFMRSATGPTITTTFTNNIAGEGGGMFVGGPGTRTLTNVVFRGNQAQSPIVGGSETGGGAFQGEQSGLVTMFACTFGGPGAGEANSTTQADGGAILSEQTNMEIVNSFFFNNTGANFGGAARMTGSQRSLFRQCTIQSNTSPSGGGVYVDNNADVAFDDCILRLNTATAVGGQGGALFLGGGRPVVYNCSFTGNSAPLGAGIFNSGAGSAIIHSTIADIRGTGRAIQFSTKSSDPVIIRNSIVGDLWANPISDQAFLLPLPPQVRVRFSDVEIANIAAFNALAGFGGNINCNPLLTDAVGGNVHLLACSPAIDRALDMESDDFFAGVTDVTSQWNSLLSEFFEPCSQLSGHCRGDYDDNAATDDTSPTDGFSDRDGNPLITDSPAVSQTLRPSECQSDMGADETTTSITAALELACLSRGTGDPAVLDCATTTGLVENEGCTYCIGDDVFIDANLTSTCPGEFTVTWYRRNNNAQPCPPATIPGSGDVQLPSASFPNISVVTGDILCINNATAANSGCFYAVARRQSCGDTQPPPPEFELNGNCVAEVAACTCITVGSPPMITSQPAGASVCDGTPVVISVTASGSGDLCYQWYRRATACDGVGSGGTLIPGQTNSTLRFLPARAQCPGDPAGSQDDNGFYYVVVSLCDGDPGSECTENTSTCAQLTVYCPPAITGGGSATVCGGGSAGIGGVQDCCYTVIAPAGCVPVVTWYKNLGNQNSEADDIVVTTGSLAGVTITTLPLGGNQYSTCIVWDLDGLSAAQANALAGNYYVKAYCVEDTCVARSANCSLTVRPQPVFTVNPVDAAVCEGSPQCFDATVTYAGTTGLCWEWRRKPTCETAGDGEIVASGTWSAGSPLTFEHCVPSAQAGDEQCYFFRIRVCTPNDLDKCPWVASDCGCLDVRPQLIACELECDSGLMDALGNCLYCPGSRILLCCDIEASDGPLCYQWQEQTEPVIGAWVDIPGETASCLEILSFDPVDDASCYRVRVNYSDLSGPTCPETSEKCDAVYSEPICLAATGECCEIECPCKDNSDEVQEVYSLWTTGDWDQVNGEWSFDRTSTDGPVIKSADDFYLCESSMHRITTFTGQMLVKQSNPLLSLRAKLRIYKDCDGSPGELIEEFDSECAAFIQAVPDGFALYQFQFFLDCFWLKGGSYWASLVAIAPVFDDEFEAFWATVGEPGNPPIPTVMGMRPVFMEGEGEWQNFDGCCHPCADLEFCIIGESCPIIWNNGTPDFGGADDPTPEPPHTVFGTRSEKSTLTPRNSRAADQFQIKTCDTETVCYLEAYIYTNCISFEAHLEIYENDCREPDFALPGGTPYYQRVADQVIDLGFTGLRVGTTNVRAYKVIFCDWPNPLVLEPGGNFWASISVRDTFSSAERAYFAHVGRPCEPCTEGNIVKIDSGKEIAPGRQIPDWQSVGADFAFLVATQKHPETEPGGLPVGGDGTCAVDLNDNSTADVQDIFLFLSAWFTGCP